MILMKSPVIMLHMKNAAETQFASFAINYIILKMFKYLQSYLDLKGWT